MQDTASVALNYTLSHFIQIGFSLRFSMNLSIFFSTEVDSRAIKNSFEMNSSTKNLILCPLDWKVNAGFKHKRALHAAYLFIVYLV